MCTNESIQDSRTDLWADVISKMSLLMEKEVGKMTVRAKTAYILSGCHSWVPEWLPLYVSIINYVNELTMCA